MSELKKEAQYLKKYKQISLSEDLEYFCKSNSAANILILLLVFTY